MTQTPTKLEAREAETYAAVDVLLGRMALSLTPGQKQELRFELFRYFTQRIHGGLDVLRQSTKESK